MLNGVHKLPGLTALIKQTFFPDYAYKIAVKGPIPPLPAVPLPNGKRKPPRTSRAGMAQGRRVDREIKVVTEWLNCEDYHLELDHFIHTTAEIPKSIKGAVRTRMTKLKKNMHIFTRQLCVFMHRHKYTPFATQVPVGMWGGGLRLATLIDVMCKDEYGRWILLEVKTGFERYYECTTGNKLRPPFDEKYDSVRNQHQIQLAFTRSLYSKMYKTPIAQAMVIRIDHRAAYPYLLEDWAANAVENAYAALVGVKKK